MEVRHRIALRCGRNHLGRIASILFKPVSLTTLVDSPVIAGSHFRTIKLTESAAPSFQIDMVSDSEAALADELRNRLPTTLSW